MDGHPDYSEDSIARMEMELPEEIEDTYFEYDDEEV